MTPLASYGRLLELAGPTYVVVAFVGRLPLAMSQLGTLLLVSTATGSYGLGGLSAGALAVANAVGAPVAGSLADRVGQRWVVLVQSLLGAAGLAALVAVVGHDAGDALVVATAGATGLVLPQIGPLARVRWRPLTRDTGTDQRRLVDAAFSYEGAADEASFAVGPALVGLSVAAASPSGALLLAAVLLAVFGSAFALDPSARTAHGVEHATAGGRLVGAAFVVLVAAQLSIGMLFGATQTGATVLATDAGTPGVAGLVHASLGVGSALAGLGTAFLPERVRHERRALVAAGALLVLSLPLLVVDSLVGAAATVLLLGVAVAPYMIAVFTLAERVVPAARVGAAMTLLASATGLGYALGSSVAGRLADTSGATAAFGVTVACDRARGRPDGLPAAPAASRDGGRGAAHGGRGRAPGERRADGRLSRRAGPRRPPRDPKGGTCARHPTRLVRSGRCRTAWQSPPDGLDALMPTAGPRLESNGHDHLASLLADVHEARRRLERGRHLPRAADQQVLRNGLLAALESYAGAVATAGAPLPYQLRREIELLRGLTGRS